MANYELLTVSSLDKIVPDVRPELLESGNSMLKNERFHFQAACFTDTATRSVQVRAEGADGFVQCRIVEYVPSVMTCYPDIDDYVLTTRSGIFPDVLSDPTERELHLPPGKWTAFWFTVDGRANTLAAGKYDIEVIVESADGVKLCGCMYALEIVDRELDNAYPIYTNWIHCDCICGAHDVRMFSDKFYSVFDAYLNSAVSHGMTMLYTPLFTPPLDTAVYGQRPTAQLIDVAIRDGTYRFGFEKLDRYIDFALSHKIKQIEFSHLFTQWGAKACPKIVARVNGRSKRIFGWETKSNSRKYRHFLSVFLPALTSYIEKKGIENIVYFHISDEPDVKHLPAYRDCRDFLRRYLSGYAILDAMSSLELYESGGPDIPVVQIGEERPFTESGVGYWAYYCCGSRQYRSNRYLAMPSQRTRILGIQLYAADVKGFLHWGFNFYNSVLSGRRIDPYRVTDADGAFPSGDAFIVYPNGAGIRESVRHEVFFDGLQDYSALKTLERRKGREFVLQLLREEGVEGFEVYPRSARWHADFRKRINRLLERL